ARDVIFGYTLRWRIESFHKTWKSGACNVEETQLRSQQAVTVWATLLAAVAARIERLKLLSRSDPEKPASIELDPHEIRALIVLKREYKKKTEVIPDTMPTIGQATRWIADLGGYTGRSSGGPPGAITIRRGLDYLKPAADLLRRLEAEK
ncbi:MAG TPA: IS4 family transposase, partial [Polyangiaceae bacterium]|nr:IS4 family transposase [Polyangiaceae bacterium]